MSCLTNTAHYDALLFDLDGTLADTATVNAQAYAAALLEQGIDCSVQELISMTSGRNWRQFLPELLGGANNYKLAEYIAERKKIYYADMIKDVLINTALLGLLKSYRSVGKTALVTTASSANVQAILTYHQLSGLFDVVVTGDDVRQHKPHPEAYLLAIKRLQVNSDACLTFEDSDIGVTSAQLAGLHVVKVVFPVVV